LQQFELEWFPFEKQRSIDPSMPQEANSPEKDTLDAANSPPQKCVAMVRCMPESRISKANDMDKNFFIYTQSTEQMIFKDIVIYIGRTLVTVSLIIINNSKVNLTENTTIYNNRYWIELVGMEHYHMNKRHNNHLFEVLKLFYNSRIRKRIGTNLQA